MKEKSTKLGNRISSESGSAMLITMILVGTSLVMAINLGSLSRLMMRDTASTGIRIEQEGIRDLIERTLDCGQTVGYDSSSNTLDRCDGSGIRLINSNGNGIGIGTPFGTAPNLSYRFYGDWYIRARCINVPGPANNDGLVISVGKIVNGAFALDPLTQTPLNFNRPNATIYGLPANPGVPTICRYFFPLPAPGASNDCPGGDGLGEFYTWANGLDCRKARTAQFLTQVVDDSKVLFSPPQPPQVSNRVIGNGQIISEHITNGAITGAVLDNFSVDSAALLDLNIATVDIGNDAVNRNIISDHAVTSVKIANDSINSRVLADGLITGANIANGEVMTEHFDTGAVHTEHVKDGELSDDEITDLSVTGADIKDLEIVSSHIVNNTLNAGHVPDNTQVLAGYNIADGQITTNHVLDFNIRSFDVKNGSIETLNFKTGGIALDRFSSNGCADGDLVKFNTAQNKWLCKPEAISLQTAAGVLQIATNETVGQIVPKALTNGRQHTFVMGTDTSIFYSRKVNEYDVVGCYAPWKLVACQIGDSRIISPTLIQEVRDDVPPFDKGFFFDRDANITVNHECQTQDVWQSRGVELIGTTHEKITRTADMYRLYVTCIITD